MIASLAQFSGSIAGAMVSLDAKYLQDASISVPIIVCSYVWLIGGVIADVTIALSMMYLLSRYDSSFQKSKNIIRRITRLILETGSVTAIVAVCLLVLLVIGTMSGDAFYFAPSAVLAKVYSNSLMVLVNSRMQIVGRDSDSVKPTSGLVFNNPQSPQCTEIWTEVETNIWRDPAAKERDDGHASTETIVVDQSLQ
ncbi:hypothetical protein VNI00_002925 [Paramarasmius palmivorus]|uniref:DUF6534 domain-containing protein n=1 Tax=Paramarasmius palmivorus TaxID=297713 RepID=A0AAW0DVG6_9AGAR